MKPVNYRTIEVLGKGTHMPRDALHPTYLLRNH